MWRVFDFNLSRCNRIRLWELCGIVNHFGDESVLLHVIGALVFPSLCVPCIYCTCEACVCLAVQTRTIHKLCCSKNIAHHKAFHLNVDDDGGSFFHKLFHHFKTFVLILSSANYPNQCHCCCCSLLDRYVCVQQVESLSRKHVLRVLRCSRCNRVFSDIFHLFSFVYSE